MRAIRARDELSIDLDSQRVFARGASVGTHLAEGPYSARFMPIRDLDRLTRVIPIADAMAKTSA